MSGVAAISASEATIGLVPRYLRGKNVVSPQAWADDDGAEAAPEPVAREEVLTRPVMLGLSDTEELRQRIAEATTPEKRRPRLLWFALAAVVILAVVGLIFPDAIAAMMPDVDASL